MLTRGHAHGELLRSPFELAVDGHDADLDTVDEDRHLQRLGPGRTRAVVGRRADHVVACRGKPVHHVKAVRHAQAGLVVVRDGEIRARIEEEVVEIARAAPAVAADSAP